MHLQPVFEKYPFFSHYESKNEIENDSSVSEDIFNRGVCLPSDIKNTEDDMNQIIDIIRGLF